MISDYEMLYDYIASILPTNYATSMSFVDETTLNEDGLTIPTTRTCGIYFKSGFNGNRCVDSGQYETESVRLVLNIYGENTTAGMQECLNYCEQAKITLDSTINKEIVDLENNKQINITCLLRVGNINGLGRNGQGIPVFSINYNLIYS